MPHTLSDLRHAIDNQDVEVLKQLLDDNPHWNLNAITPNGLSAIWWALMPKNNLEPSVAIISALVATGRIDPTQCYLNNDYMLVHSNEIYRILYDYENEYHREHDNNDEPENNLIDIAQDSQNTHLTFVVKAIDKAVVAFYKLYGNSLDNIDELLSEINQWINDSPFKNNNALKNCLERIANDTTTNRTYTLQDDITITLTQPQVLVLIWHAIQETNSSYYVIGTDMSAAGIDERKKYLMNHLIMAQNEYGENNAACWMGTRNQIVGTLDNIRVEVNIAALQPLTPERLAQNYAVFCKEQLQLLEKTNRLLHTDYLKTVLLQDLPGGGENNEGISMDLNKWLSSLHHQFTQTIFELNASLDEEAQLSESIVQSLLNRLITTSTQELSYDLLPDYRALSNLLATISHPALKLLFPSVMDIEQFINQQLSQLPQVSFLLIQVMDYLQQQLIKSQVANWFAVDKKWANYIKQFSEEKLLIWAEKQPQAILLHLQQGQIVRANNTYFYQTLSRDLIEKEPTLGQWLKHLPLTALESFFNRLLKKEVYFTALSSQEILAEALQHALLTGYLTDLPLTQPIYLTNQDLRGIDLSNFDLTKIHFSRCDLRLTGILSNTTIQSQHFNDNQFEDQYLSIMLLTHAQKALAAFWHSSRCTTELLSREINLNGDYYPSMIYALQATYNYTAFAACIKSPVFAEKLLFKNNEPANNNILEIIVDRDYKPANPVILQLIASQYCSTQLLLGKTNPPLYRALANKNNKVVAAILNSPHCTEDVLLKSYLSKDYSIRDIINRPIEAALQCRNLKTAQLFFESKHCTQQVFDSLSVDKLVGAFGNYNVDRAMADYFLNHSLCTADYLARLNEEGNTILTLAISRNLELAKLILEAPGCTPALLTCLGDHYWSETPLWAAIGNDKCEALQLILNSRHCSTELLMHNANSRGEENNCLQRSINLKRVEMVKAITASKHCTFELLNSKDSIHGWNTLTSAVLCKSMEMVKTILMSPAFHPKLLKECDRYGQTAIDYAKKENNTQLITLFNRFLFPKKYFDTTSTFDNPFDKAHALLKDYSKDDSMISRFFHGYWRRHHIKEVVNLVKKMNHEILTMDELLAELDHLETTLINPCGDLAKTISFIRQQLYVPIQNQDLQTSIPVVPIN